MTLTCEETLHAVIRLRRETRTAMTAFQADLGPDIETYRKHISDGVVEALDRFRSDIAALSGNNEMCTELTRQAADYVDWLQWTFWDLPHFAVAIEPEASSFRHSVASCGLIYLSIRVLDDILDRHFWYRGRHLTLLATVTENRTDASNVEGLTFLGSMLLCFEGLTRLISGTTNDSSQPLDPHTARLMLERTVSAIRRVLIGMTMERSSRAEWNEEYYERLVELKNVDYWRSLYAAVDPGHASPLYPFLEKYYALAQKLNDVQDFTRDESHEQPNLVSLHVPKAERVSCPAANGDSPSRRWPSTVENLLARDFLALAEQADGLPEAERAVARFKLGESLEEACRLGLFTARDDSAPAVEATNDGSPAEDGEAEASFPGPAFGLSWFSELPAILERVGAEAIETVACPICSGEQSKLVLHKQGFRLVRCDGCAHVYVNPRLCPDLQARIGMAMDEGEDDFLEIQRVYTGFLCHLLQEKARGRRLLDIGFGKGYLMQAARAFGFEVFGIDGSEKLIQAQRPMFGARLHHELVSEGDLPWGHFDVVIMSHVIEHFPNPEQALARVRAALNPGGLLYAAVPDIDSCQFRVFGKRWNVINPIVHYQYFHEGSLSRLLENSGFEILERVFPPPFPAELNPPQWMQLFRDLGGSDSGELAILARATGEL